MSGNDIRVCSARASFALNSHKVYCKSYKNAIEMIVYSGFYDFKSLSLTVKRNDTVLMTLTPEE